MAIINNIDELKETVKINSSTPWKALIPYLDDARDKYLIPYLGLDIVKKLESDLNPDDDSDTPYLAILPRVRRILGPFAMAFGTSELSINFGDTGHTVTRTDNLAPASDSKIEKSENSLINRAYQNLEYLLQELELKKDSFPAWENSDYYKRRKTKYFDSAAIFQDSGMVNIEYSRLTFEKLRQHIMSIEETEMRKLLTSTVADIILEPISDEDKEKKRLQLLKCIKAFIGNRVAELYTSQTTRIQRSKNSELEYKAIIRPLYDDPVYTANFYSDQVSYWREEIIALLPEFGVDVTSKKMKWNAPCRKLFNAEG